MKSIRTLLVVIALGLLFGCGQDPAEPDVEPLALDEIDAERLWERITDEAPYETYSFWPGEEGVQPGQAPHGPFHRIFVNSTLRSAVPIADQTAPNGTIIVKENMDTGQEMTGFTVMAKVDGFDPENGDWFWAAYAVDGQVRGAGAMQSCITCHEGMRANDYIIVRALDRPLEEDD